MFGTYCISNHKKGNRNCEEVGRIIDILKGSCFSLANLENSICGSSIPNDLSRLAVLINTRNDTALVRLSVLVVFSLI